MIIKNGCITEGQRMTEFMRKMFAAQDSVKNLGLIAGIVWALPPNPKKIIEEPISATLNAVIYGSLCAYSASKVAEELPTKGKWIFAGLLGASTMYHICKNMYSVYKGSIPSEEFNALGPLVSIQITHSK